MQRPALLVLLYLLTNPACADSLRQLTVDAAKVTGTLRSLAGVNGAPAPGMHKPMNFKFGGWDMPEQVDASAGYRLARIDLVRTHDAYGPGDIDSKFETNAAPGGALISAQRDMFTLFPDPHADPDAEASYRFAPTDKLVTSITKIGAQVIFRLGRSEGADSQPPPDFARYANIAKHVVLHYNRGWAHGFHLGVRYWEIWNEPDLGKVFWGGTAEQYFDLYGRLARAVKEADPSALVGGPAIARPNDASPYIDSFLKTLRRTGAPLDFYSWHWYASDSEDPQDFIRIARSLRARLDRYGFRSTRSFLTEWNAGLGAVAPAPLIRATFLTSSLIYMQDAPIDAATLYRADSVFGLDGATPDRTGQALIALGRMQATPIRIRTRGADQAGFAVAAGRSRGGQVVQVLISNYQIPADLLGPRGNDNVLHVPGVFDVRLLARRTLSYADNAGFELTVEHLPAGIHYVVERCLISDQREVTSEPLRKTPRGTVIVRQRLPPPGIELLTFRPADVPASPESSSVAKALHCATEPVPIAAQIANRLE